MNNNSLGGDAVEIVDNSDRRYFPRWQVRNRIVYRTEDQPSFFEARSRDLSCTGVCMISSYPMDSVSRLKLRIYLFDDKCVEVEGRVVWHRVSINDHFVGIAFSDINSGSQETILRYAFDIKKNDVVNHWFEGWDKKN